MKAKLARSITLSLFISFLSLGQLSAQDVTKADELVRQLEVKPESGIRTRSITVNVVDADQGRASFNTIQFEYDSATLTQESTGQLTELGKALSNDRLLNESFVIEGHADAHGDDQYNKELSLRRATTVKNFLATRMGVADDRLRVVGHGEERPKTDDPYDAENRRVDVVNLKVAD
jgi:outer membrane protein OmpA-like peptidoglycan-associated protein